MGYHPRIETALAGSFITTRCRNSELWFVGVNPRLEETLIGSVARCADRYHAKVYALGIEGNHVHMLANFPELNRADFMRDVNSAHARAVQRHVKDFPGGGLWGRRYSSEIVPFPDFEKQFFYIVLQAVQDGFVSKISEWPFYNCFNDAIWGRTRKFKVIRWGDYHVAVRNGHQVTPDDFADEVSLTYERLPGYEHLSQIEYAKLMRQKLEEYRQEVLKKRIAEGKTEFLGREKLLKMVPGSRPVHSKTSRRDSHRPRVLSACPERWRFWMDFYFGHYWAFKEASAKFKAGDIGVEFPLGMYRPNLFVGPPVDA